VLAGMVLGAMAAFIIDKQLNRAAVAAFAGAVLAWIGLIHAPQLGWGAAPGVALGYAMFGLVCLAAGAQQKQAPS
jgi:AGZA family xanthine/uracil permease-like MFS transporter